MITARPGLIPRVLSASTFSKIPARIFADVAFPSIICAIVFILRFDLLRGGMVAENIIIK